MSLEHPTQGNKPGSACNRRSRVGGFIFKHRVLGCCFRIKSLGRPSRDPRRLFDTFGQVRPLRKTDMSPFGFSDYFPVAPFGRRVRPFLSLRCDGLNKLLGHLVYSLRVLGYSKTQRRLAARHSWVGRNQVRDPWFIKALDTDCTVVVLVPHGVRGKLLVVRAREPHFQWPPTFARHPYCVP